MMALCVRVLDRTPEDASPCRHTVHPPAPNPGLLMCALALRPLNPRSLGSHELGNWPPRLKRKDPNPLIGSRREGPRWALLEGCDVTHADLWSGEDARGGDWSHPNKDPEGPSGKSFQGPTVLL
uniref:Uncharacterized protein n=1 Tax=Myotis myotis TaxID=51298 RepID=A0A7J7S1S4_MYOMY|nr:hypothetical protein mMyoMyo1_010041 [Myotis myotis]